LDGSKLFQELVMNTNETKKGPGEAEGDGQAAHGYRNEVSWDGGKGYQPYTNQEEPGDGVDAMPQAEGGSLGEVSGRNIEQLEAVKQKPEPPVRESRRET
jgi:hypothetical protein